MTDFNKIIYGGLMILVLATRPEGLVSRKMTKAVSRFFKKLFGAEKKALSIENK